MWQGTRLVGGVRCGVRILRAGSIGAIVGAFSCLFLVAGILGVMGELALLWYETYVPMLLALAGAIIGGLVGGELHITLLLTRSMKLGRWSGITESAVWAVWWGFLYGASMAAYVVALWSLHYVAELAPLFFVVCCLVGGGIGLAVAVCLRVVEDRGDRADRNDGGQLSNLIRE
jgi:hypothetical protein